MPLTAKVRLFLTAAKDAVVAEGDPGAAFLYAAVGDEIPDAAAEHFGLVDGRIPAPDVDAEAAAKAAADAEAAAKAEAEAKAAAEAEAAAKAAADAEAAAKAAEKEQGDGADKEAPASDNKAAKTSRKKADS